MTKPKQLWTIRSVLEWTRDFFGERGIDSARLDAEVLLARALKTTRVQLYINYDAPLGDDELAAYRALVGKRAKRVPLHYIVGEREFWSLPFTVDPRVLVPRPESEVLIEEVLTWSKSYSGAKPWSVADVGTGSGCLAITLAHELDQCRVWASDISAEALAVARLNADRNGVADRIVFTHGAMLSGAPDRLDLLISNPPYIPSERLPALMPEVRDHEPRIALDGGPDGLVLIRELLDGAADRLNPGGAVIIEFDGDDQVEALTRELDRRPRLTLQQVRRDYADKARALVAIRSLNG